MIDGTFAPLDMIFSEAEMLMILRSTPVGQYLQPTGNWDDGLVRASLLLIEAEKSRQRKKHKYRDEQQYIAADNEIEVDSTTPVYSKIQ